MNDPAPPWFEAGLAFECTRCGACCTGAPGFVWVGPEEIGRLADHLGLSLADFARRYVRRVGEDYSLIERPNGDCVFWDRAQGCTVYDARPEQCRTWPFWPENLEAPDDWRAVGRKCPGVDRGPVYPVESITAAAARGPR